jgi:hypothetical protein
MQKTAFFMANLLLRINTFWARDDYQPASRRVCFTIGYSPICLIGVGRECPVSALAMRFYLRWIKAMAAVSSIRRPTGYCFHDKSPAECLVDVIACRAFNNSYRVVICRKLLTEQKRCDNDVSVRLPTKLNLVSALTHID